MAKKKSKKQSPAVIQVDIVSDIVCPWCWLGARYFFKAAKQTKHHITVTWRPYMLDPTVREPGVPYRDYMKNKFGDGPSDKFKAMREHLEKAAPTVGINFRFDDIPMRPNTLNAHRLMKWANGQKLGNEMAEALFRAFFDHHRDVGDPAVLAKIADEIGMDGELVSELLAKDEDRNAVMEEMMFFRNLGINGVPCFIYQGQFAVQGAQEPAQHLAAIEKAASLPAEA
ncbi:MAG: DsbA family oxidoreductase [Hellea sp.]|nr:DsbA family oxidoreductase [Hellea sp.]